MTKKANRRKKVAILMASEPEFDKFALKYFLLSLNRIQSTYEFAFPDVDTPFCTEDSYTEGALYRAFTKAKKDINFDRESDFDGAPDFFINIITSEIEGNLFFTVTGKNVAFVTTYMWEKYYSPPSLFEYLLQTLTASLILMHPKIDLGAHDATWGCALDYCADKEDEKVDISLGYLCDKCRKEITNNAGADYLSDVSTMMGRKWIGSINKFDSVAYNLKRFFKFDIDKDSGFNKTFWERVKEDLPTIPKEFVVAMISFIFGVLIVWLTIYIKTKFGVEP